MWCLAFSSTESFNKFLAQLNDRLFENLYKKEATAKNTKEALGDYADMMYGEAASAPMQMDWEAEDPEPKVGQWQLIAITDQIQGVCSMPMILNRVFRHCIRGSLCRN